MEGVLSWLGKARVSASIVFYNSSFGGSCCQSFWWGNLNRVSWLDLEERVSNEEQFSAIG